MNDGMSLQCWICTAKRIMLAFSLPHGFKPKPKRCYFVVMLYDTCTHSTASLKAWERNGIGNWYSKIKYNIVC